MAEPAGLVSHRMLAQVYSAPGFGGTERPEQHQWGQGWSVAAPAASRKLSARAVVCAEYSWPPPEARSSSPGLAVGPQPVSLAAVSGSRLTCVSKAAFSHNQLSFGVMDNGRAASANDTDSEVWAQARRQEGSMPPKRSAAANKTKLPDVSGIGTVLGREGEPKSRVACASLTAGMQPFGCLGPPPGLARANPFPTHAAQEAVKVLRDWLFMPENW